MASVALITGVTGQDGSYLAEFLLKKGYEVHGMVRRTSSFATDRIDHLQGLYAGSGATPTALRRSWRRAPGFGESSSRCVPDEVYNLAAQSHVRISFDSPNTRRTWSASGTLRLLEAIARSHRSAARGGALLPGRVVGDVRQVRETPQRETTPFHPRSPYACAKVYAHWQTVNYREAYGLFACNGILFNHESPRRGENFVTRKITRSARAHQGRAAGEAYLGNLDAKRDWGFAGDYVEAMWLMLQQDKPDDYVVATGETHSVREFLRRRVRSLELNWQDHVEIDPRFFRPAEVDLLIGDPSKAKRHLGWTPKVKFEWLAELMIEADLELAERELRSKAH